MEDDLSLKLEGRQPLPLVEPGLVQSQNRLELSKPGHRWLLERETQEMATSRVVHPKEVGGTPAPQLLRLDCRGVKGRDVQSVAQRPDEGPDLN